MLLAADALPAASPGKLDLAAAPRRALVLTLQLASVLLVGVALLAVTQPFLPSFRGALVLVPLLLILGIAFWRSATDLQGHVRAGAEVIVEALAAQSRTQGAAGEGLALEQIRAALPGLGDPVLVRLFETSNAVGKTLAQLDLRGLTGATVLAVQRVEGGVVVPTAIDVLQAGDVLALAGSADAIDSARAMLDPVEA